MNNPLIDGWTEFQRRAMRWQAGFLRWREARRLYHLETELGELCWQQVDFDPTVEQQIQSLNSTEGEQARLTNEIAGITEQSVALNEDAAVRIATLNLQMGGLSGEHQAAREKHGQTRDRLTTWEANAAGIQKNITQTELLADKARQQLHTLYRSDATSVELIAQRTALEDQQHLLNNTMLALKRELGGINQEIALLEKDAASLDALISQQAKTLSALAEEEKTLQRSRKKTIDDLESRRQSLIKQRLALDTTKKVHFQHLGSQLADYDIGPRNQPQTLAAVRQSRELLGNLETRVSESLHASAAASPGARHIGLLWLLLTVAVCLSILFLLGAILFGLIAHLFGLWS